MQLDYLLLLFVVWCVELTGHMRLRKLVNIDSKECVIWIADSFVSVSNLVYFK